MTDFYHVCFAVPDLDLAMRDLTRAAAVSWFTPQDRMLGDWEYRIVFSADGPRIELIQGPPGSPWDTTDGPRFDHLGWWAGSLSGTSRRLAAEGFPVDFDGCPLGRAFTYHRVPSIGARMEVVDVANQAGFLETWGEAGVPTAALG